MVSIKYRKKWFKTSITRRMMEKYQIRRDCWRESLIEDAAFCTSGQKIGGRYRKLRSCGGDILWKN